MVAPIFRVVAVGSTSTNKRHIKNKIIFFANIGTSWRMVAVVNSMVCDEKLMVSLIFRIVKNAST